jgi:hypothetical protein
VRFAVVLAVLGSGATSLRAAPAGPSEGLIRAAMTLDRAVAAGTLAVEGRHPESAFRIELVLTSLADLPLRLDVAGRHLEPTGGRRVQRLGLAHPVGPVTALPDQGPGVFAIELPARTTRRLLVNCCCMDLGIPDPKPTDRYVLAGAPTPAPVEAALRWWVDHPKTEQRVVNEAIWALDPSLLDRLEKSAPPPPAYDGVRSVARTLHALSGGDLRTLDPYGALRLRASGVRQVFPEPFAVHALLDGGDLARLPAGDGAPERLFALGDGPVHDFWSVPRGPFLWRTERGVFLRSSEGGFARMMFSASRGGRLSLAPVDLFAGRFVLVDVRPVERATERKLRFDVHDVDAGRVEVSHRKTFWNVADMAAGPGGVFALTPAGGLLRLRDGRLDAVTGPGDLRRLVAVGRRRLVAATADGRLVAVTPGSKDAVALGVVAEKDEAGRERVPNAAFDPVTDDLVWVVDRTIRRLPAESPFAEGVATFPRRRP